MRVLLMRHTEAEDGAALPSDAERKLTAHGRETARRMGECLQRMDIRIDRIVSSPLVRARETASLTAEGLGWTGAIQETDALGFGFSMRSILKVLEQYGSKEVVMLVGHEPDMSRMMARFLDREGRLRVAFKKGAVCCIDFFEHPAEGEGALVFYYRPKLLLKLLD